MKRKQVPRGAIALLVEAARHRLRTLRKLVDRNVDDSIPAEWLKLTTAISLAEDYLETTDSNGSELEEEK